MSSSLDKLTRPPAPAVEGTKEAYKGTEGQDRATGWIIFRRRKGPRVVCSYLELRHWEYNHEKATSCVTLYFASMVVLINGHDLDVMVTGLLLRTLTVVEEFDPESHETPASGVVMVDSIEVLKPTIPEKP